MPATYGLPAAYQPQVPVFAPRGKTAADIRCELAESIDRAQDILDGAMLAGRQLDPAENAEYDGLIPKIESLQGELRTTTADEARRQQIAQAKVSLSKPPSPIAVVRGDYPITGPMNQTAQHVHHRINPTRAFKGPHAAQDAYASGQWFKAVSARCYGRHDDAAESYCRGMGWDVFGTATEGAPTGGGYLVPAPLSNAIIDVRALAGVSRQIARVVPMTSETLDVPKKTAGTTVYYPGEGGSTTASDQTWAQIHLTAKKRAILSKVSQELRDDSIIPVMDDLASQMGTDFAVKEDAELFKGDGTSTYGGVSGLLTQLGAAGISTPANGVGLSVWSGLTITQFANAMALLPDKYHQCSPSWVCSSVFYFSVMLRVQAAAGGNTITTLEQAPVRGRCS